MKYRIVYNTYTRHYEVQERRLFGWRTHEYCFQTFDAALAQIKRSEAYPGARIVVFEA